MTLHIDGRPTPSGNHTRYVVAVNNSDRFLQGRCFELLFHLSLAAVYARSPRVHVDDLGAAICPLRQVAMRLRQAIPELAVRGGARMYWLELQPDDTITFNTANLILYPDTRIVQAARMIWRP